MPGNLQWDYGVLWPQLQSSLFPVPRPEQYRRRTEYDSETTYGAHWTSLREDAILWTSLWQGLLGWPSVYHTLQTAMQTGLSARPLSFVLFDPLCSVSGAVYMVS